MMAVKATSYCSPTLVLLAFDWPGGQGRNDFLGFAIERTPGFWGHERSWLPNRIDFDGPAPDGRDKPSRWAPIQKFMWWDARIDTEDRGKIFHYRVVPIVGSPENLREAADEGRTLDVPIPPLAEGGVGTYFNRAVVSSQAFARQFPRIETMAEIAASRAWLANGMEDAVPSFLEAGTAERIEGAIYHLTDDLWVIPALERFPMGKLSLLYNRTSDDHDSDEAIARLVKAGHPQNLFAIRSKASIMHNKFLVRVSNARRPEAVLLGSANFTSSGLCQQANVLHTFESPPLAKLYLERKRLLDGDPTKGQTAAANQGWSEPIALAGGEARVFFPPEKKPARVSMDRVIQSIRAAESSVVFCCFIPTDMELINACFQAGDDGRMLFGLVNSVEQPSENDPVLEPKLELYHRSRDHRDVAGKSVFAGDAVPFGFSPELKLLPGENQLRAIRIHHKFIVVDAETEQPILYTGSANLSNNSLYNNDENLLEVVGSRQLADAYLAEFLRLYEHYRARIAFNRFQAGDQSTFKLTPDARWARKYYRQGSPEYKARLAMVQRVP
jgi:PLD-like domain